MSLEELFSADSDVPLFYIDTVFTELIFSEPVILNGKIYEKHNLVQWIKENETDPITREDVCIFNINPIYKSSFGLDSFMTSKVKNYFEERMNEKNEIDLLVDICSCIVNNLNSKEEHYEIAKKLCYKKLETILKNEEKKLKFSEMLIKKCENNSEVFEKICKFTIESGNEIFQDERFEIDFEIQNGKNSLSIENIENLIKVMIPNFLSKDYLIQKSIFKSSNNLLKPWKKCYLVLTRDFKLNLYSSIDQFNRNKEVKENSMIQLNSASISKIKNNIFVIYNLKKKWTFKLKDQQECNNLIQWLKLCVLLNKN
eukprot:gene4362-7718_t